MFLIAQHWGCDSRLNWLLKPSDVITAGLNLLKYIYWLNTLMCATCWQRLWWMCVFDVHSAVLTFPRSTPWSRRLALENNIQTFAWLAGWSVPSSHHCPQARLTSSCHRHSAHRGMCPYALHGLGRLTQRHRSLTSNLLPNWVIPLTAASKLHFCCFFSSPLLLHLQHWCLNGFPLIASPRPWLNGDGASLRPQGAPRCIPSVHAAQSGETRIGEASVSGREGNPAQRGTTEIRRYPMQQHRRARYSSSGRQQLIWLYSCRWSW